MNDIEKWSEYIEKYCGDDNNIVNDEIKEALLAKPVFLTRFVFRPIKCFLFTSFKS
jgi:hypothetical protein